MSVWLGTANRVAGSFRGRATAQAQRMVKAAFEVDLRASGSTSG